jgi:nitroreductase
LRDKTKREAVARLHPYAKMASDAPLVILVCADTSESKEPGFWQQDCTAALQNILLAARGKNLGTVWCGMHPIEERVQPIQDFLEIPSHINILGLVVLGHPAQPFHEVDRYREEKVHYNGW